jgi:hypothetical protein
MKFSRYSPFTRIWIIATLVGIALGIPAALFSDRIHWFVWLPIVAGTLLVLIAEVAVERQTTGKQQSESNVPPMPSDFWGLSGYRGRVALAVRPKENEPGQGAFDFFRPFAATTKPLKTATILRDEQGTEIYVIDTERFVTLLVNRMISGADQVSELSLLRLVSRYSQMRRYRSELERLLRDRGLIDVIKADYRGNLIQVINRTGETIIRDLAREAKERQESKKSVVS